MRHRPAAPPTLLASSSGRCTAFPKQTSYIHFRLIHAHTTSPSLSPAAEAGEFAGEMENEGNSRTSNASSPAAARPGGRGLVDRTEFVRVIIQCLYSLGYRNAAAALESESGVPLDAPEFTALVPQVIAGRWEDCVDTIDKIDNLSEEVRAMAAFLVWSESFLELLNSGGGGGREGMLSSALDVLRRRISPLGVDRHRVHKLARRLVSLERKASEDVVRRRVGLVLALAELLPPWIRLPGGRLEHLVEIALLEQRASCVYHNSSDPISLYEDHLCSPDQIPSQTAQILSDHKNEVWFVQFSNNGEYLASSSKDYTAIIWKVEEDDTVSLKHILEGHSKPVSFVAWSPDDTMLITCGNGEVVKLWDVQTGMCISTLSDPVGHIISSCAWFPDSKKVVCGSCEPENCIYMCDLQGKELKVWKGERLPRVSSLAVTPNGEHLISVLDEKVVRIYDFDKGTEVVIPEEHAITSLSLSKDGRFLIVNLKNEEIHLWNVDGKSNKPSTYKGHKQAKYVIRSCFGGPDCSFIASGSEDSQVYIWHRERCMVIKVLPGHGMTVNSVSWNPTKPRMLASASDDRTVRIWLAGAVPKKIYI